MLGMRKYLFIFFLFTTVTYNAVAERNPVEVFFTKFFKNTHVGISIGGYSTICNHGLKTKQIQIYVVDKNKAYLFKEGTLPKKPTTPPTNPPGTTPDTPATPPEAKDEYYLLQWPDEVFYRIYPEEKGLKIKIQNEINAREGKKYEDYNVTLKAKGWTFPIRFITSYECGSKLRINFEPSIDLMYIKEYEIKTSPPDDSDDPPKLLGKFSPAKKLTYKMTFPLSLGYNFWRSRFFNLVASARGGLKIPSFFRKGKYVDLETFWDVGFSIESNSMRNLRPFLRFSFSRMDSPDKRINKKESAIVFSTMSFGAEFGITFRLWPDKGRCPKHRCTIKGSHVHDYDKYRGRSYFSQKPRNIEKVLVR